VFGFRSAICFALGAVAIAPLWAEATAQTEGDYSDVLSPPALDDGWAVAAVEEAGFDRSAMRALAGALATGEFHNVHMLLIERNGKLVYEQYLSGPDERWGYPAGRKDFDRDSLHDLRSVSKSVTSLLVGAALGEAFEAALDRPVLEHFPDWRDKADPAAGAITLRHVLTMSSGLEWNEMDVSYASPSNDEIQMYFTRDPMAHVWSREVREPAGERWYYSGGMTVLLAGVVESVTGAPFLDYAKRTLFEPLGITDFEWVGPSFWPMPAAASGLRLRGRDLAKIGSLMLHGGEWAGRRVAPKAWTEISGQTHRSDIHKWGDDGAFTYGLHWWRLRFEAGGETHEAIVGRGYGGQRLFILRDKALAVTTFAGNYGTGHYYQPERILIRIVEALR